MLRPAGLCETCAHVREVKTRRGTVFYRCALAEREPELPKYPRLPTLECSYYTGAARPPKKPG